MSIESHADLVAMQRIGRAVALILQEMCASVRKGMTTAQLDAIGAAAMKRLGVRSAPQLTYRFPGFTCISVNEEIVHGVPRERRLESGDVVKIDVTAEQAGYIADAARTVIVDGGSPIAIRLQACAVAALAAALGVARADQPVSLIGRAVEAQARKDGFAVVRELCGHGVGRTIHEHPEVPNYENRLSRDRLTEGLVIAIEPMLSARPARPIQGADGWTLSTHNRTLAVHEEHTVVIQRGGPLVLTMA
jgi:methionyl aminopeptidase